MAMLDSLSDTGTAQGGEVGVSRNMYPGVCYSCGASVPTGFGHYERHWANGKVQWKIKCVKCASGRNVKETDPEVQKAIRQREERRKGR